MEQTTKHEHQFSTWEMEKITRVHEGYAGTPGDKAFLTRLCKCGAKISVDYGASSDIEQSLWNIIAKL